MKHPISFRLIQNLTSLGFRRGHRLLLGLSGGHDSVSLFHLLLEAGIPFETAHLNYGLRGEESEEDARFVQELCKRHEVPFHIRTVSAHEWPSGQGIQEAAREMRYAFFKEILDQQRLNFILTAHHGSDQAETLLWNLLRYGGWRAWNGMAPRQGNILRPLLGVSRDELRTYSREEALVWREDRSNQEVKYMRNLIRNEMGPLIGKINPDWEKHLMRQAQLARELYELHLPARRKLEKQLFLRDGEVLRIPLNPLRNKALARQILADYLSATGFSSGMFEQIFQAAEEGHEGAVFKSGTHVLYREKSHFRIFSDQTEELTEFLIETTSGEKQIGSMHFSWETGIAAGEPEEGLLLLDVRKLNLPLLVRSRKTADYFYPLGMGRKKKKVSKFLKDSGTLREWRDRVPVFVCGEKICAVGLRADERFAANLKNPEVLLLKIRISKS